MVYCIFVQRGDGTYATMASCDDLEQAVQIVETLSASWPRKYEVRDSRGNNVYVREKPCDEAAEAATGRAESRNITSAALHVKPLT
jgi:hypothetical protein